MNRVWRTAERGGILAGAMVLAATLCGCVVVGVSSRGGWFVWPRGFGLVVVSALLMFLLLRRRR
jgi:protein-S-isoprenylcysteine O-methyltransferase Ste14